MRNTLLRSNSLAEWRRGEAVLHEGRPSPTLWELRHLPWWSACVQGTAPQPLTSRRNKCWQHIISPVGSALRITKLLMKNTLLRSNSMAWWMALSAACGLVSDLFCVASFAFRATGQQQRCISERGRRTLCSQTPDQHFVCLCCSLGVRDWYGFNSA